MIELTLSIPFLWKGAGETVGDSMSKAEGESRTTTDSVALVWQTRLARTPSAAEKQRVEGTNWASSAKMFSGSGCGSITDGGVLILVLT